MLINFGKIVHEFCLNAMNWWQNFCDINCHLAHLLQNSPKWGEYLHLPDFLTNLPDVLTLLYATLFKLAHRDES